MNSTPGQALETRMLQRAFRTVDFEYSIRVHEFVICNLVHEAQ